MNQSMFGFRKCDLRCSPRYHTLLVCVNIPNHPYATERIQTVIWLQWNIKKSFSQYHSCGGLFRLLRYTEVNYVQKLCSGMQITAG